MALRWGIAGAGRICHDYVTAVRTYPDTDHKFVAVADWTKESAAKFAVDHDIPKSYGSYIDLAKDTEVGECSEFLVINVQSVANFILNSYLKELFLLFS